MDINSYAPRSGRILKEDGTIVNEADLLQTIALGVGGSSSLVVSGSFNGNGNMTKTFEKEMRGFVIVNDSTTDSLVFTIGDESVTIKPREPFEAMFKPFTVVTIVANGPFRAYGLEVV